jgi:MFS family permease
LTLFFLGYILFEVPANITLKRTSPKFWLPTLTLIWGIVTTLQGVVQNLTGFYIVRFFLGVAEGGLFPGVIFYLGFFYLRDERQFRVSFFFSAASLAGAFGGVLAYGIAHMAGVAGLNGWRWIFIIEGIFTVLVSIGAYFFISDYPETSKFLSEDEKHVLAKRLEGDNDATPHEGFSWANVAHALGDPKVWLYCFAYHSMSLPLYTLSLFLPTIIASLGYTAAQAQLLTVPPYVLAFFLTLGVAWLSEKYKKRTPFAIASASVAIIGYIILLANNGYYVVTTHSGGTTVKTPQYNHPGISYLGVFFAAAGIYPASALALGWPAVNVSGGTKRATAGGLQITIGNLGAIIGTQLYRAEDTPRYTVGHSVALGYLVLNILVTLTIYWYNTKQNKKREALETVNHEGRQWNGDEDPRWRFRV